ncbi:hypothetical protein ACS8E9_17635 [Pseudomonas neustonica]|uniref:MFS transporter n=1 Tax=Pseudomonas neustonica TaxID=2487346 RepID=A0ABX9XDE7_9PSED|nr:MULTISPECIES: hypothetical protein [Pseudomonas]MAB25714.1 hypothetical protein [Pseudomonadales bacterium]MBA6419955.1 hypothetical protein [Pseudomonas sp. 5Ae-yellow]ROZ80052.1 hypothetical protein EF099_18955 [Pseudomonas sp. SSM44]ROZ80831.1 hypothetical protein EF096_18760 [Pseudomonas neustonica]|tara:strand:+ start:1156 stop:2115 length:960 start_codon:yes stop_codon:yes gene_type:complete
MESLLILSGLVACLCAWVWLAVASRRLSVGLFVVALIAPVLTLFMRGKGYSRPARALLLMGMVIALGGLALMSQQRPQQFEQLISGRWAEQPAESALSGMLMEQPFAPNDVRWQGKHLIFTEKVGERIRRSLVIKFDRAESLLQGTAIDLLPGDPGPWPEIVLQWYTGALEPPGLRRLDGAYSMSLSLAAQGTDQTRMTVHLHLPADYATRLTGTVLLQDQPQWLGKSATVAPIVEAAPEPEVFVPEWQEVSVLALLDEPRAYIGKTVRLSTTSGKVFSGLLKEVTAQKRVVLSLPQGANQVDFQFHPVDIQLLEMRRR